MKKYVLLNKDTLKCEGNLVGSPRFWKFTVAILFALLWLVFWLFVAQTKNLKIANNEAALEKSNHNYCVDSLQEVIDYCNTMIEECNLHSFIGQLYIKRSNHTPCTKDNIWKFINTLDVWYPEYIMAQAIQESECGRTSPKGSNNLFGMTLPSNRETTAMNIGTSDKYSKYKNWELSVIDRVLWELYVFNYKKPTKKEYLKKLKSYAEDEHYLDKIGKISETYKKR